MARGFQSHHDEEPQRLTTAAARSTEESARLRDDLAGATDEFAFEVPAAMSVGTNSILASSDHSSGEDAVHATLATNAERPLRTSTFTKLAGTVLDRASLASSQSSDGYGSARSGQFNDSLIRSPEFDKMSLDATPVTQTAAIAAAADENNHSRDSETVPIVAPSVPAPSALPVRPAFDDSFQGHRPMGVRMTIMEMSTGPTSSEVEFRGTERQRRNTTNYYPSAPVQLQARFTSGMAANDASMHSSGGMSRELEQNAFTASMSESTYLNMRKTLDPEAMLNGDPTNSANMAVLSSLRPVTDPFDLTRDPNLPGPDFQRGRAATTGTAMVSGRMTVGRTTGVARGSSRLQRSYTVAGSIAGGVPAPAILAHDPRGTFRTTTADTAQQIFASQQVRLQNKWGTDVWIYMKNSHPFLGLCTAHRWHPYKKKDRALVLLTTLLLALLLTGLYATQQCCQSAAESAVAVIAKNNSSNTKQPHRRLAQSVVNCRPFGATCDATTNLCSLGASCVEGKCVPLEAKAATMQCSATAATSQCPAGWRCASQGVCRPSTSLVCYLSAEATAATRVKTMALDAETRDAGSHSGSGPDAPLDALSAIAALLKYGKDNNLPTDGSTVPPPATTPVPPPATVRPSVTQTPTPTTATPVATTPTPTTASVAPTPTPTPTTAKPPLLNSTVNNNRDEAVLDPAMINATVETLLLTLKQPLDQGVYTVASKIPIVWEVKVLQGERSFVDTLRFRVDFSKDGGKNFTMIASDIASDSVLNVSPIKYHFTWDLAHDDALACSNCVLRVCTQPDATTPSDPFCIRTDGATAMTSTATATASGALTAATSTATTATPRITFHIVRDIVECACGIKHAAFVTYSYLLALAVPVALLVLEQLVTFYQDSKVLGMFARRGGPKMPMIGFYASEATARGRLVLVFLSVGLVFACGMVAARISKDNFPESTRDVLVLWVLMFALVVVVGFIYCSIIYCIVFTVRWYQDEKTWNQQGFADFAMMFDDSRNNQTMLQSQQSHGFAPPDPATAGSYQWPFAGDASGSVHSTYSQAVVTQRSGQAIV